MTVAATVPAASRGLIAAPGQVVLAVSIGAFLALFLVIPVATVIFVAFTEKGSGAFTLVNFLD